MMLFKGVRTIIISCNFLDKPSFTGRGRFTFMAGVSYEQARHLIFLDNRLLLSPNFNESSVEGA